MSPLVSQKLRMLASTENSGDLDALRELIEAGKVIPAIDRTYPLAETAAAITYVQDGHARGKVVITYVTFWLRRNCHPRDSRATQALDGSACADAGRRFREDSLHQPP